MSDKKFCGSCRWFVLTDKNGKDGACTEAVPQIVMVPAQTLQGRQMIPASMYPNIHVNFLACGRHTVQLDG